MQHQSAPNDENAGVLERMKAAGWVGVGNGSGGGHGDEDGAYATSNHGSMDSGYGSHSGGEEKAAGGLGSWSALMKKAVGLGEEENAREFSSFISCRLSRLPGRLKLLRWTESLLAQRTLQHAHQNRRKDHIIGINSPPSSRPASISGSTKTMAKLARTARRSSAERFESELFLLASTSERAKSLC